MIRCVTLGRSEIRCNGGLLSDLTTQRQKCALLIYIAVEGPVSRERLLSTFWPERDDEKARHSLSQALYGLKQLLREGAELQTEGGKLSLRSEAVWVDAGELEAAARRGDWERVIELYEGPFLEHFTLRGSPEFEKWCDRMRSRLGRLAHRAFGRVTEARAAAGDVAGALQLAWRWQALEPLEDEAQHTLIALLALTGDRTGALEQYATYRDRLAQELDAQPLDPTRQLVKSVRAGETPGFRSLEEALATRKDAGTATPGTDEERPAWRDLVEALRERRVGQVGLAYAAVAWLAVQLADTLADRGLMPEWLFRSTLVVLAVGFPLALLLAWAQEEPSARAPRILAAITRRSRWPEFARKLQPVHVLAPLIALVIGLVAGSAILHRRPTPTLGAATLDPHDIAVLYFEDRSPDSSLAWLSAGLTEGLIDQLDLIPQIDVISNNGSRYVQEREIPFDSIGAVLRVGTLVTGAVEPFGDSVMVTVRLVDPLTRQQVGVFSSIEPIVQANGLRRLIAEALTGELRKRLGERLTVRGLQDDTQSNQAWRNVLAARALREEAERFRRIPDYLAARGRFIRADSLLSQAERLDPDWLVPVLERAWFARHRALLELWAGSDTMPPELANPVVAGWIRYGLGHAERALARSPDDTRALEMYGLLLEYLSRWAGPQRSDSLLDLGIEYLVRATTADSTRARAFFALSSVYDDQGRIGEAILAAEAGLEADLYMDDARRGITRLFRGSLYLGRQDDARHFCELGRRLYPDYGNFITCAFELLAWFGETETDVQRAWEALSALDTVIRFRSSLPARRMEVATIIARAGMPDSARAVIAGTKAGLSEVELRHVSLIEAWALTELGEYDRALELLERDSALNRPLLGWIAGSPWFKELRGDPRFQHLVAAPR